MNLSKPIDVSVIVPSHNSAEGLFKLVDSALNQLDAPSFEIIIVSNPPKLGLKEKFSDSRVHCLNSTTVGANHARNIGIERSSGEVLLFVDDDCFMHDPLFIRKHWDLHNLNPSLIGLGGGYYCAAKSGVDFEYWQKQCEWLLSGIRPGFYNDLLIGGNMSFKAKCFESLKFDESLRFGGTETEFIYQLALLKLKTKFFPDLVIEHKTEISFFSFLKKAFKQGKGDYYLFTKNFAVSAVLPFSVFSPRRSALGVIYNIAFESGKIVGFGGPYAFAFLPFISIFVMFRPILKRVKYFLFVRVWCAIEAAVFI